MTVPNQKIIKIHREETKSDFLGIKNENWKAASRDLGATALRLYLYFAANRNGYNLELSPQNILNEIGMPPSTYRDQFKILLNKGYIFHKQGNIYEFYEKPQHMEASMQKDSKENTACDFDWS